MHNGYILENYQPIIKKCYGYANAKKEQSF